MYILTIIFLVGLIMSVQQSFLQYTSVDATESMKDSEYYILRKVADVTNQTLQGSSDCTELQENINYLSNYINSQPLRGGNII